MHKYQVLLLICLVSLLFPATSLAQEPQPEDEPFIVPTTCAEAGELTMWIWSFNWEPLIRTAVDNWIDEFCPEATVEIVRIPFGEYWPALRQAAEDGNMPDIYHLNHVFFREFANNGRVLNLQPYFDTANIDTYRWGAGVVGAYRYGENDDLYAVPVNIDTVALFYNKDMFNEIGLPYPFAGWDWDTFAGYAALLNNPDDGVYGAAVYASYQSGYANWIAATGITPLVNPERTECTLTDLRSRTALRFLRDLYEAGLMPDIETLQTVDVREGLPDNSNLAEQSTEMFLRGEVAMLAQGSWRLPIIIEEADFEWGVVPLPRHPGTGRDSSLLHSVGYVASSTTEQPDLSANLLIYLAGKDAQRLFAEAGGVAPAHPSSELFNIWFDSFGELDVNIEAFVTTLVNSQSFTVFDDIWDYANTEFETVFLDPDKTVQQATEEACAYIETFLTPARVSDAEATPDVADTPEATETP